MTSHDLYNLLKKHEECKGLLPQIIRNFEGVLKQNQMLVGVKIGKAYDDYFIFYFMNKIISCGISIDLKSGRGVLKFENVTDDGKKEKIFSVFIDDLGNVFETREMTRSTQNLLSEEYFRGFIIPALIRITEHYKNTDAE